MKKIISVVGPTASGKTSYALKLAEEKLDSDDYSGIDLISVDSRQVYRELEVLSGADIPDDFIKLDKDGFLPYFIHNKLNITLHGVGILNLEDEWSVAHFRDFATKIILSSFENNRLPILVGGTGLYHQHLFNKDENLYVPPNDELREKAKKMSIEDLQDWLKGVNAEKLESMNNSDINNPRRLIRAIEITLGQPEMKTQISLPEGIKVEKVFIDIDLDEAKEKILQRVKERFSSGAVEEVENLLEVCKEKDLPICSTLGVSDLSDYISGKIKKEDCIKNWALHEYQYAKRQLTWFKKQA